MDHDKNAPPTKIFLDLPGARGEGAPPARYSQGQARSPGSMGYPGTLNWKSPSSATTAHPPLDPLTHFHHGGAGAPTTINGYQDAEEEDQQD